MSAKKKTKKSVATRDEDDRRAEVATLKKKLSELGLTGEFPEIAKAFETMDEFVTRAIPATMSQKLPGLKRILHLQLCNRRSSPCSLSLTYDQYV